MNYPKKSYKELLDELRELNVKYDELHALYEKDISSRNEAEKKHQSSEDKFRKAFFTSPDSININRLDDGMYISINHGFTKISGYQEEEVIGKTSGELGIWAEPSDRDKLIKGLREKGEVENLETKFRMKDGLFKDGIMSAAIIDLDGIPHILSITRDITERKQSENALKESERSLREAQTVAHLGSFVWDLSTDLWKSSEILDEIFGIDENYSRSFDGWSNIVHPEMRDLMRNYVKDEVLGKKHKFNKEYQITRQNDGNVLWVHGLAELEYDPEGKPVKLIGSIIDITDRKQVEYEVKKLNAELENRVIERTAQLEAANSELQAFAYSVSHDLRAPLRAINGFSKFVLEDYSSKLDSEGQRLIFQIRSNTQKMDRLITDILALSKVTRSEHKKSKVDMAKMALSMLNEAASPEIQKHIKFIIGELPECFADPTYIKQVWINLISNAIKFSSLKLKPEIKIGGYIKNGFRIYYVRDNGVGFNPEYSNKLFGVFQRLHKSDEFEGTGVGLAIVQRIIHRHGGTVWAEGKEGKGATFYFSLPDKSS
jgi:PAS domain S-box-containing protein